MFITRQCQTFQVGTGRKTNQIRLFRHLINDISQKNISAQSEGSLVKFLIRCNDSLRRCWELSGC